MLCPFPGASVVNPGHSTNLNGRTWPEEVWTSPTSCKRAPAELMVMVGQAPARRFRVQG